MIMQLILALLSLIWLVSSAKADSLDDFCRTVRLPSNIAICSDSELRALTIQRQQVYDQAKVKLNRAERASLLSDQNGWVKSYPIACGLRRKKRPILPLKPTIQRCMARAGRARIAYLRAYVNPEAESGGISGHDNGGNGTSAELQSREPARLASIVPASPSAQNTTSRAPDETTAPSKATINHPPESTPQASANDESSKDDAGCWSIADAWDRSDCLQKAKNKPTESATTPSSQASLGFPVSDAGFEQVSSQVGCKSVYSEAKQDDIWKNDYDHHWMTWSGSVEDAKPHSIGLKITALTFDVIINLEPNQRTYDLQKGQRITVRFLLTDRAGCFLPFSGEHGQILSR